MSPDEQPVQPQSAETAQEPEPAVGQSIEDISPEPPNEAETLAEQEEAPPPSTVHPAAAAGSTLEDEALVAGRKEHGEYFIGMWDVKPNFGCPYCYYSTIESNGDVEIHVLTQIETGDLRHMAALQLKGE